MQRERNYIYPGHKVCDDTCDYELQKEPGVLTVHDGYILPLNKDHCGGVTDHAGNMIRESLYYPDWSGQPLRIERDYPFRRDQCPYYDGEVVYIGAFVRHWGHFLYDCVTRLWLLLEEGFSSCGIVLLPYPGQTIDGNYLRFFELFGTDASRILIPSQPVRIKKILIPEPSNDSFCHRHTEKWGNIFQKVSENARFCPDKIPGKVYFSRTKLDRLEFGEERLEAVFRENGFAVFYPEQMCLDDQIGILQCADLIVSTNSSIVLNGLFAGNNLRWVLINKYKAFHMAAAEVLGMKAVRAVYIDAYPPFLCFYGHVIGTRPYLMGISRHVRKYLADHGMKNIRYRALGGGKRQALLFKDLYLLPGI